MNTPLLKNDGAIWKMTISRDITEIKQMGAMLLQTEKMASIGQLAAGIAHEINNPIGFISSNLKMLSDYEKNLADLVGQYRKFAASLKEEGSETQHLDALLGAILANEKEMDIDFIMKDLTNLISESREGADRIKEIINNIKYFAHPGDDKIKNVDVNHCIETTLRVIGNELKHKAVVIKELGEAPFIKGFPQELNQVVMNLLVNALQAIEEKGEIRITTSHDHGFVRIVVSDNGHGILEENLTRIFNPFFTTKEVGKGTGLGLSIAFNIVRKHHGSIDVKSRVGEGTTFVVSLPIAPLSPE
jgi:signal transduction histidine kinase